MSLGTQAWLRVLSKAYPCEAAALRLQKATASVKHSGRHDGDCGEREEVELSKDAGSECEIEMPLRLDSEDEDWIEDSTFCPHLSVT